MLPLLLTGQLDSWLALPLSGYPLSHLYQQLLLVLPALLPLLLLQLLLALPALLLLGFWLWAQLQGLVASFRDWWDRRTPLCLRALIHNLEKREARARRRSQPGYWEPGLSALRRRLATQPLERALLASLPVFLLLYLLPILLLDLLALSQGLMTFSRLLVSGLEFNGYWRQQDPELAPNPYRNLLPLAPSLWLDALQSYLLLQDRPNGYPDAPLSWAARRRRGEQLPLGLLERGSSLLLALLSALLVGLGLLVGPGPDSEGSQGVVETPSSPPPSSPSAAEGGAAAPVISDSRLAPLPRTLANPEVEASSLGVAEVSEESIPEEIRAVLTRGVRTKYPSQRELISATDEQLAAADPITAVLIRSARYSATGTTRLRGSLKKLASLTVADQVLFRGEFGPALREVSDPILGQFGWRNPQNVGIPGLQERYNQIHWVSKQQEQRLVSVADAGESLKKYPQLQVRWLQNQSQLQMMLQGFSNQGIRFDDRTVATLRNLVGGQDERQRTLLNMFEQLGPYRSSLERYAEELVQRTNFYRELFSASDPRSTPGIPLLGSQLEWYNLQQRQFRVQLELALMELPVNVERVEQLRCSLGVGDQVMAPIRAQWEELLKPVIQHHRHDGLTVMLKHYRLWDKLGDSNQLLANHICWGESQSLRDALAAQESYFRSSNLVPPTLNHKDLLSGASYPLEKLLSWLKRDADALLPEALLQLQRQVDSFDHLTDIGAKRERLRVLISQASLLTNVLNRDGDLLEGENGPRELLQQQWARLEDHHEAMSGCEPPVEVTPPMANCPRELRNWCSGRYYVHPQEWVPLQQPDPFHQLPRSLRQGAGEKPLPWGMAAAGWPIPRQGPPLAQPEPQLGGYPEYSFWPEIGRTGMVRGPRGSGGNPR